MLARSLFLYAAAAAALRQHFLADYIRIKDIATELPDSDTPHARHTSRGGMWWNLSQLRCKKYERNVGFFSPFFSVYIFCAKFVSFCVDFEMMLGWIFFSESWQPCTSLKAWPDT